MFRKKVQNFFWEDVEKDHLEKVKSMEDDKNYNEGMKQLAELRKADVEEMKAKKLDAQTAVGVGQIIVSAASIAASVFLGIFAYHKDEEMEMSNGKVWNISNKLNKR